jgi:hypothetical protein
VSRLRILVRIGFGSSHSTEDSYQILEHRKCPSNDEKDRNIWLRWAVVEVDAANDNHTDRDDYGDTAGDGTADSANQEQDHLDEEIDHVPAGLVRVADPTEQ